MAVPQFKQGGDVINPSLGNIEGFDIGRLSDVLPADYVKTTELRQEGTKESMLNLLAGSMSNRLAERFKNEYGRDATQPELASLFNGMNWKAYPATTNIEPIIGKIDQKTGVYSSFTPFDKALPQLAEHLTSTKSEATNWEKLFENLQPKFEAVTLANEQLKSVGGALDDKQVNQIVSNSVKPENAERIAAQFVNTRAEELQRKALEDIPQQQEQAITEFEKALQASQGQFFQEQLVPQIQKTLSARGLLQSGSLAEALGGAGERLQRGREQVIAPLRAEQKLGAVQQRYGDILRSALESGRSLDEATRFARDLFQTQQAQNFAASQGALNRQAQQEQTAFQTAMQLATTKRSQSPSGLDYFLNYGLPAITTIGGAVLGGPLGAGLGSAAGGATGKVLQSQYGGSRNV